MADKFIFKPTNLDQLKDTYDIVIIGSGSAGLTAALEAHKLGKQPVVLEKKWQPLAVTRNGRLQG